jgi:hypothetical protein
MKKKVLVTAKAEPVPSTKYGSAVCTAGITEDGEFIRLYPVQYRVFCDSDARFNKYDWIEVDCERSDTDSRRESYKIKGDIKVVGHIGTDYNWAERNSIVLPLCSKNFSELIDSGASLGLVRPSEVLDFVRANTDNNPLGDIVKNHHKAVQIIFDEESNFTKMKPIPAIGKIDRYYRYKFKCPGEETVHEIMCEDWELYQSSRSWINTYGTEEAVWEKIHEKFFDKFKKENDLHFFVGTHNQWKTWIIIGVYYPPLVGPPGSRQMQL